VLGSSGQGRRACTEVLRVDYKTYLPAFLTGVMLVLSFPKFGLSWLAFIALVPLLVSLWKADGWKAVRAGLFAGIIFFYGTLYWLYHSIHFYGGLGLLLSLGAVFLLSLVLSVLYMASFAFFYSRTINNTSLPASLVAPLFWVVLEFLRSVLFTGFPWNLLGYTQYDFLRLIQVADLAGVYGVSFLVVAVNGALADLYISKRRREERPLFTLTPTLSGYAVVMLLVIAVLIYGTVRLGQAREGEPMRVSIVQGNIEQDMKWNPLYQRMVIKTYEELTRKAVEENKPDLVVWPETSMPFVLSADVSRRSGLETFQKKVGVPIIFGVVDERKDPDGAIYYTNSAALLKDGKVAYVYDKVHLVPFGEYVPMGKLLFFIDKLVPTLGNYRPGRSFNRGVVQKGEFGVLICYEIIFPDLVRKFFRKGGDFIVTITNDAWFGRTPGPYQHFAMAVFRAVENRKPVIRAANTGISGIITPDGEVAASTDLFSRSVLTHDISTDRTVTFYSHFGDLFVYFCTIVIIIIMLDIRRI
jgi:apolipoprotein N-acyltransferase